MLIDTHCHLSFKAFNTGWQDAVKRAREKDIQMICVGAAKATSEKSITISKEDGVFASIGLHPTHVEDETFDQAWFSEQADNPKVVAIGETGVDYYHIDRIITNRHSELVSESPNRKMLNQVQHDERKARDEILEKQEILFKQHLQIAKDNDLPVILHTRDGKTESTGEAYSHLMRVLREFEYYKGVVHCFGGDWKTAQKILDAGLMLSFTGIVTYKNAPETLLEVVRNVPPDRFMIETDSPYLAPEPMRGKQNEPLYVEHVARGIAEIRGQDYDTVAFRTTENARRFFNLPSSS